MIARWHNQRAKAKHQQVQQRINWIIKQNSKKQRSGKQSASSENDSLKAQIAKYEEEKLIAEGKQSEVIEKLKMDNKDLLGYKDKYNSYLANEKQSILEQFPEADREELAEKDLDTLKYILKKTLNKQPQGNHIPSIPSMVKANKMPNKEFSEMTKLEKRQWHESMTRK